MTSTSPLTRAPNPSPPARRSPLRMLMIAAVVVALAGAAFGAWYFLLRTPPAPVGLGGASPTPTTSSGPSAARSTGASAGAGPGSLEGTWSVDPSVGSFSDFSGSFVGYRVKETLGDVGLNTAVGRTPAVTGSLTVAGTSVTAVEMTADLAGLKSDDDRRDGQLRRQSIQTDQFPNATFKLTSPIELTALPADGATISATATGDFTLHGVTKSVQIPIEAKRSGDVVTVVGSLPVLFADYDIEKPRSQLVVSIEDNGIMEFQLHVKKA